MSDMLFIFKMNNYGKMSRHIDCDIEYSSDSEEECKFVGYNDGNGCRNRDRCHDYLTVGDSSKVSRSKAMAATTSFRLPG